MNFWGADTEDLVGIARRFRDRGEQLKGTEEALRSMVAAVSWTGPDAEGFRERWEQCRQELSLTADHLGSTSEHLARQAAEQDGASDPNGQIDASDYDGMLGGEFLDWSDVINTGERVSDLWRDRVEAGDAESPLGERYPEAHPGWDPSDVGTDQDAIENSLVNQGSLGDCWYLAALMAVQQTDPGLLAENISGLGEPPGMDGWEVRPPHRRRVAGRPRQPQDLGTRGTMDDETGNPAGPRSTRWR